jgi:hypothetical protein
MNPELLIQLGAVGVISIYVIEKLFKLIPSINTETKIITLLTEIRNESIATNIKLNNLECSIKELKSNVHK